MGIHGQILVNLEITQLTRTTTDHAHCDDIARTVFVEEAFYDLDADQSGDVSITELFCWLERDYTSSYGLTVASSLDTYDTNRDNVISYDEFFSAYEPTLRDGFEVAAGSDSQMTISEFMNAVGSVDDLRSQNLNVSIEGVSSAFAAGDLSDDGVLSADEYMLALTLLMRIGRTQNSHVLCSLNSTTIETGAYETAAFAEIDTNADGSIVFAEFKCQDETGASDASIRNFFEAIDTTRPYGFIDSIDFAKALLLSSIQSFTSQDVDGDNVISENEFLSSPSPDSWSLYLVALLENTANEEEIRAAFQASDADSSSGLDFKEYTEAITRILQSSASGQTLLACEPDGKDDVVGGDFEIRGLNCSMVSARRATFSEIFKRTIADIADVPTSFVTIQELRVCVDVSVRKRVLSNNAVVATFEVTGIENAGLVNERMQNTNASSALATFVGKAAEVDAGIALSASSLSASVSDTSLSTDANDDDSDDDDVTVIIAVVVCAAVAVIIAGVLFAVLRRGADSGPGSGTNVPCGKASDLRSKDLEMHGMHDDYESTSRAAVVPGTAHTHDI